MAFREIPRFMATRRRSMTNSTYSVVGLVVLLAASPLMGSCGGCTDAACAYTLSIDFVGQTSWDDGTWTIEVEESDTEVGSCSIELPESTSSSNISCSGQLSLHGQETRVGSVDTTYGFTGGQEVTLTIRRNGEKVTQSTLEPNFERYYPNGPDCGGECWQATVQYAY
jgi:hypothetical protein